MGRIQGGGTRLAKSPIPADNPPVPRACFILTALLATCVAGLAGGFTNRITVDVLEVGRVTNAAMTEVSGMVASRKFPGTFWIHTDGRKQPRLVAINRDGETLAQFDVAAKFQDWEDLSIDGDGRLYLGDIGNNDGDRKELRVHRIAEPDPSRPGKKAGLKAEQTWHLRFPGKPFDCESLFIVGTNGYLVSKLGNNAQARLYRFPLMPAKDPVTLAEIGVLPVTSPVTGAAVSKDGRLLAVVSKNGAFVFRIDGDPANAGRLGRGHTPLWNLHIEGCTFVEEGLLATSETRAIYLFTSPLFRDGPRP